MMEIQNMMLRSTLYRHHKLQNVTIYYINQNIVTFLFRYIITFHHFYYSIITYHNISVINYNIITLYHSNYSYCDFFCDIFILYLFWPKIKQYFSPKKVTILIKKVTILRKILQFFNIVTLASFLSEHDRIL